MAGQEAFNPDSSGYDIETAKELMELYPLTIPKPNRSGRFDRETIGQDDAFQAWVWHGEENDWVRHGGTLDPRTGMYLKGMAKNAPKDSEAYKSMRLGIEEEESRGNKVIFKDGRYYSAPSLTEKPTSKSMDDIIQQSNLMEALAPAVSTRTQPSGKAISDISIPTSEKYGDPGGWSHGLTKHSLIPMNMLKLRDAMTEALTSPKIQKSGKSQKEIAEQTIGELLGFQEGFNKTREGKSFIKKILNKYNLMNRPGGLVAYRTEEGFPTGSVTQSKAAFRQSESGEGPDTLVAYSDRPNLRYKIAPESLVHESIHAAEGDMSMGEHQARFDKVEEDIVKYNWVRDLLYNAMMDKESEGAKLLKGFIK